MADVLSALDETFLELEELEPGALMSIGAILVFDALPEGGAPTLSELRASRLEGLGQLPRYAQRLSTTRTGRFARPCWEPAERFDIADHVHHAALPAPGGDRDRELFDWTGEFFSHPLDRTKPLWELVLIEGLEGGAGVGVEDPSLSGRRRRVGGHDGCHDEPVPGARGVRRRGAMDRTERRAVAP